MVSLDLGRTETHPFQSLLPILACLMATLRQDNLLSSREISFPKVGKAELVIPSKEDQQQTT